MASKYHRFRQNVKNFLIKRHGWDSLRAGMYLRSNGRFVRSEFSNGETSTAVAKRIAEANRV